MSDLYDQMINRFLMPLSSLNMGVTDALYFMREDGAFIFTEGYCHPSGGLLGKVMLYPSPDGDVDIFGKKFRSSYKRVEDGRLILIPHREQMALQFEINPSLDPHAPRPVYSKYHVSFSISEMKGVFEHRHSLRTAMEIYPGVRKTIEDLSRAFDLPPDRLGCTGSTCYGKFEEPGDDIDTVFYGSIEENRKILERIREVTRDPRNRVFEFERFWPIRFYWNGVMICSFFNYRLEDEIPLKDCRMKVLKKDVRVVGQVSDDTHTIYMPPIVKLTHLMVDGKPGPDLDLIIYDGSLRGEFYQGDYLEFKGDRVLVQTKRKEYEALLVTLRDDIQLLENKRKIE
jgi:hypothetical protein